MRDCLQYEDAWKVTFCKTYHGPYTGLWRTLVKLLKFDEALCIAEQGRAQALADLIKLQYDSELSAPSSFDPKAAISSMISDMSTPTLFVALEGNTIYFWLLCKGRNIQFTQKKVKYPLGDVAYYLEHLRKDSYKEIRGGFRVIRENRSLDKLKEEEEPPSTEEIGAGADNSSQWKSNSLYLFPELMEGGGEVRVKCESRLLNELREEEDLPPTKEIGAGTGNSSQGKSNSLHLFHECIIDPISELIEGDELIVVPDGPLCLAPFPAFLDSESKYLSESMKIRILPSLTSLKLIEVSPEDYHEKSGALLVGEPCLEQFTSLLGRPLFSPLPFARKEVEMIGKMLGIQPLTGKEATKAEVLRRISSVAVVHIAAHGDLKTGDILLAPNPEQASIDREEKGYRLTISDVQAAKMRAKLVVLSCSHSAQGEVSSEGVVGIARAFLGAGARSVLVSLWTIDDKATFEFMRIFYKHLKDGNSASVSLNRAMNCLRESEEFGAVMFWAPFVLIGVDVTIDFGENSIKNRE